jgi:hypothetical protein
MQESLFCGVWAAGFAAPAGQPYGLTTGAWITLRVTHNSTSPSNNEGMLFPTGMKEKN